MTNEIWLNAYEEGVPHDIDIDHYQSVGDYIHQCCLNFKDSPSISSFGAKLSYQQLAAKGNAFAGYLQQQLGLKKGERFGILLPNTVQYPIVILGALQAGLVVVNFNPFCSSRELDIQLKDCGATAIVIFESCARKLQGVLPGKALKHIIVTNLGDLLPWPKSIIANFVVRYIKKSIPSWYLPNTLRLRDVLSQGRGFQGVQVNHDDLAFLQYTGGTTGPPKGAMLTHGNILSNIQQTYLWTRGHLFDRQERVIVALPLYHIFALTLNFLSFMKIGGLAILITDPRDIKAFVAELNKSQFTVLAGVNALFARLLEFPKFGQMDFSRLRLTVGGGAAIQSSIAEQWQQVTGSVINQAYGLTEASPGVCCNPLSLNRFNGSVGVPLPSTLVEIRSQDGHRLPEGGVGELFVKGPQVMRGYWQNPEETKRVISSDGWLGTGDIALMDKNGYIFIVDRKKDMIIVSGFNVYPNEIEEVLVAHPEIDDAAVIGVPDDISGELVKAFIVRNAPTLEPSDIEQYCRKNLSAYKVPRRIVFIDEIPKTNVGKILRRQLRTS